VFDGFALERVDVGDAVLRVRHGGDGPPVVLLHGHPRTHATWHKVAPRLAGEFTPTRTPGIAPARR
jgi:haloacetate dehalogenase